MPLANVENVESLVGRMLEAMTAESDKLGASAEDTVSAIMTLALRTIKATRSMHCNMDEIRHAVGMLVLECYPDAPERVQ